MVTSDLDSRVRLAAFSFLSEQTQRHGDVLSRELLSGGFTFEGQRVPLVGPQGIFKPAVCELPLSITTSPPTNGRRAHTTTSSRPMAYCVTAIAARTCSITRMWGCASRALEGFR